MIRLAAYATGYTLGFGLKVAVAPFVTIARLQAQVVDLEHELDAVAAVADDMARKAAVACRHADRLAADALANAETVRVAEAVIGARIEDYIREGRP